MLVRLSKNTFVRDFKDSAYIFNQLTQSDKTYNETGADYLKLIKREPKDIEEILSELSLIYGESEELSADFKAFVDDLAAQYFLVVGNSKEELDANDVSFSYDMPNLREKVVKMNYKKVLDEREITQYYMDKQIDESPFVFNLQFELTSRCNERCIHCYIPNDKKDKGIDMPTQKVLSILDEFVAQGGLEVTLSGGEVLLHKGLPEILRYCRQLDLRITILTNLISLTDKMVEVLKEVNINFLQVSLYSMNAETHDKITTVKGSYDKTMTAIKKLIAADIPIQISCPAMRENHMDYLDVLKFADSLRVKASTDYILMGQSDLKTDNLIHRLTIKETEELVRTIMLYDEDYSIQVENTTPPSTIIREDYESYLNMPMCGAGCSFCCITADGNVYPCAGWQNMVLGNVYKQSLTEIWQTSEKVRELRKVKQRDFPKCLDCEARDYCEPCMVRNYNESNGDYLKIPEHCCEVAFLIKRLREELLPENS